MSYSPVQNRIVLTSYPRYFDAQAAVDRLSDADFPVEETSIVGRDLRLVEDVTGRLSYSRAALRGAAGGAWFGLLFGLFLGLFAADATSTVALVLWGLLFGALAGVVFSVIGYAMTGGRRDFVSVSQLVAERYDVVVESRTIDDARRILGMGGMGGLGGGPTGPGDPDNPVAPTGGRTSGTNRAEPGARSGAGGIDRDSPAEPPGEPLDDPDEPRGGSGRRGRVADRAGFRGR